MIEFRAAEPEDLPALRRLGARWEPAGDEALVEELTRGDPAVSRLVAVEDGAVVGIARLLLPARPRLRHLAQVELDLSGPGVLGPFLDHLREVAFVRMGQSRLDVASADPALTPAFLAAGFAPWIERRGGWRRDGVTRDLVTWGRLAEGLATPPPLPRAFTRPTSPRLGDVLVRPVRPEDAPQWVANLGSVDHLLGDRAHCMVLGISVAAEAQGLGAGDTLLAALIDAARAAGAARLELQVYADNHRAEALYRKHGFLDEGLSPLGAWREGGWAWDRVMGLGL